MTKLVQLINKSTCSNQNHLHKNSIWSCGWSPDGQILATCGADKFIHIWFLEENTKQLKHIHTIEPQIPQSQVADEKLFHTRTVRFVSFHPKFQTNPNHELHYQFVTCGFEGRICIWGLKVLLKDNAFENCKCECKTVLEGHKNEVKCVHWSADGKFLVTSGRDKTVWIWEYIQEDDEYMVNSICSKHTQDVKFVRFHPFVTELGAFSGSYDNQIRIWKHPSFDQSADAMDVEEDNWTCDESKDVLSGHNGTIWCLGFPNSPNFSKFMTSCGDDDTIFVWELQKEAESSPKKWILKQQVKTPHFRPIFHLDWSLPLKTEEESCIMLTCSGDNNIIAYSLGIDGTMKVEEEILGAHESDVNCVKWNPNPKFKNLFVSVSDDMCIKLWEF